MRASSRLPPPRPLRADRPQRAPPGGEERMCPANAVRRAGRHRKDGIAGPISVRRGRRDFGNPAVRNRTGRASPRRPRPFEMSRKPTRRPPVRTICEFRFGVRPPLRTAGKRCAGKSCRKGPEKDVPELTPRQCGRESRCCAETRQPTPKPTEPRQRCAGKSCRKGPGKDVPGPAPRQCGRESRCRAETRQPTPKPTEPRQRCVGKSCRKGPGKDAPEPAPRQCGRESRCRAKTRQRTPKPTEPRQRCVGKSCRKGPGKDAPEPAPRQCGRESRCRAKTRQRTPKPTEPRQRCAAEAVASSGGDPPRRPPPEADAHRPARRPEENPAAG